MLANYIGPASVAQLELHPTDDQEVAGSILLGRQHFFMEMDHEIFSAVILSLTDSRKAVVSFWRKNVHYTG